MTNVAITQLVVVCSAVFGLAAFGWLVTVPAVRAYSRLWERIAAVLLSLYVLAAFAGIGVLAGLGVSLWAWPRVF
jgi:hypothetical protein